MLKSAPKRNAARPPGARIALVVSRYNRRHVNSMLRAALSVLRGARADVVGVVRVPGAYEIPVAAARLARSAAPVFQAIICLGVVIRGETTHAQHITEAVTLTLAQLAVETEVPIIDGVYLFENEAQARARCLDPEHNRGIELARTGLEMAWAMQQVARITANKTT